MPEPMFTEAAAKILDVAQKLAQTCGFNGFSYADIASLLGVTKPSLHYHFPSKVKLGQALILRYRLRFGMELEALDMSGLDPAAKLRSYVGLYDRVLRDERMCLCGMFAAEYATLPPPMQKELQAFFDGNERWLTGILRDGIAGGAFEIPEAPEDRAWTILSALEGAMLIARVRGDAGPFQAVAEQVQSSLAPRRIPAPGQRRPPGS